MKTQANISWRGMAALAGLASLAATGCIFSDKDSGSSSGSLARVQGQVHGDAEVTGSPESSGWEGAVVTTHEIQADGSLSPTLDSVAVRGDGGFSIETRRTGPRKWILRARRGTGEWMAGFEADLAPGEKRSVRPLSLESTVEAATWLELQKTAQGREVAFSEVNLAIDSRVAVAARDAYRGNESVRAELVERLAATVRAASRARHAFWTKAEERYEARRARIDSARAEASARFDASLYEAGGDTSEAREAERAYLAAFVDAYLNADMHRTPCARSAEASYHAVVRASAALSDSVRDALARNQARVLAIAADTSVRAEFRASGASEARVEQAAQAAARLRTAADSTRGRAHLDSAVARFRADVRAAFLDSANASDTNLVALAAVALQAGVATLLDSLSSALDLQIGTSADGEVIGRAYAEKHVAAQANLENRFFLASNEEKAEAAAHLFAFLSVRSDSD